MPSKCFSFPAALERDDSEVDVVLQARVYTPLIFAPDDYPTTEVWCDALELTEDEQSYYADEAERLAGEL
jgi:hypothetical protein